MTETQTTYAVDPNDIPIDSVDTEREWLRSEVMERYGISSVNTLKSWCGVLGIAYGQRFYPQAIAQFDHLHEHIRHQGMTMKDYQALIADETAPNPTATHGYYSTQAKDDGNKVAALIQQRYSGTVSKVADVIAPALWEAIDAQVMQNLLAIAETEQTTPTVIESEVLPFFSQGSDRFLPAAS